MKLFGLSLCGGLALLGCSGERSTQPGPVSKLPAVPVSAQLVASTSEEIVPIIESDSTYVFDFSATEQFVNNRFSDIHVSGTLYTFNRQNAMQLLDVRSSEWRQINAAYDVFPVTAYGFWFAGIARLSSQVPETDARAFVGAEGLVRMRAPDLEDSRAKLVEYSPDYHFATVRDEGVTWHLSMSYSDNSLYLCGGNGLVNSLVALDLTGHRRWSTGIDVGSIVYSAFDGSSYWLYERTSFDEAEIIRMDTLGNRIESFGAPRLSVKAMSWGNDRLWIAGSDGLISVDVDSSLSTGSLISGTHTTTHLGSIRSIALDSSGFIIALPPDPVEQTSSILRYGFDWNLRDSFQCNVSGVRAIAWDGGSLWVLHHGPANAGTQATLLTRFTLE